MKIKYDLNDPVLKHRYEIERNKTEKSEIMFNNEITRAVLKAIKEYTKSKQASRQQQRKKGGKHNEIYQTNRREPRNKKIHDKH